MIGKRQKIPVGAGSYFVLTPETVRLEIDATRGAPRVVAEMLINTNGNGAIVIVPPGAKVSPGVEAVKLSPLEAVELLRRVNVYRLAIGRETHAIPAAMIRRAKAETLPGMAAIADPFPGVAKTFFAGKGSWDGVGLWASADGRFSLEMRAPVGVLRKSLTPAEAELWLVSNGYEKQPSTTSGESKPPDADGWRVAPASGSNGAPAHQLPQSWWAISWGSAGGSQEAVEPARVAKAEAAREARLRDVVKRAKSLPPPVVSPPRKAPRRRRK